MNNKVDRNLIKNLAEDLAFSINESEIDDIISYFDDAQNLFSLIDEIDTTDVSPLIFPFNIEYKMRDDKVIETNSSEILSNTETKDNFVIIQRVVK